VLTDSHQSIIGSHFSTWLKLLRYLISSYAIFEWFSTFAYVISETIVYNKYTFVITKWHYLSGDSLSLTLSVLFTERHSYLNNHDSLWETRNVRSCGNQSLIKFRSCCIYSKEIWVRRGWFEGESKQKYSGPLASWVRPKPITKRCDRHAEQDTVKYKKYLSVMINQRDLGQVQFDCHVVKIA